MGLTCKSKAKTLKNGEKVRFSKNYLFLPFSTKHARLRGGHAINVERNAVHAAKA